MRMRRISRHAQTILVAAITAAVTVGGPVIARTVVDFAKNADKVDGLHAVKASSSPADRAGKLVATGRRGFLPDFIIGKVEHARNAGSLDGLDSSRFVQTCGAESLVGKAFVFAQTDPQWQVVQGYGLTPGGPVDQRGNQACLRYEARARHTGTGTYEVTMTAASCCCQAPTVPLHTYHALVTPIADPINPLIANHRTICSDDGKIVIEVHIADTNGISTDASFAIAQLNNPVPLP